MDSIIGREEELETFEMAYNSNSAELIVLFGRRRVGKTFLVSRYFGEKEGCVFFSVTGMKDGKTAQQLKNFIDRVALAFYYRGAPLAVPKNWFDALGILAKEIAASKQKRIVLFFDEFPWMVTRKSELLTAFEYFWNEYGSKDSRVKLIICGSSAGWILKKIINNRGALYNRVDHRIRLEPFTLDETKRYLTHRQVDLSDKQIAHLYMVLGGIPFYLKQVHQGMSAIQAIAHLAFKRNSFLLEEFDNLFATLFNAGGGHTILARIIAEHRFGIGQEKLLKKAEAKSISKGGTVISWLKDLEQAGFIQRYKPYLAKKGVYYKMIDEYSLFYFKWIEPIKGTLEGRSMRKEYWEELQRSPSWKSWAGYAFESICHKHTSQIMDALALSAASVPSTWRHVSLKNSLEDGAQIDLLFDRPDDTITICEIKYTKNLFVIDKAYARDLVRKIMIFKMHTKTKKHVNFSIISANGLKENQYAKTMITGVCTLQDLFKRV